MDGKDNLEKFILRNREAFDSEAPPVFDWDALESGSSQGTRVRHMRWTRYAAAAAILLLVGVSIGMIAYPRLYEYQQLQVFNESEEFRGIERYFNNEVHALLTKMDQSSERMDLESELKHIDAEIETLKIELVNAPKRSKEVILEAIIASFEAKVELMETALNRNMEVKKIQNEIQQI